MTVEELLRNGARQLTAAVTDSPRLESELLLAHALGCERGELFAKTAQKLGSGPQTQFQKLIDRRAMGEPVAYILGYRDFYRDRFIVRPGVLIPRPETEMLVEHAEEWIKKSKVGSPRVADFGCGSGCIGLSIIKAVGGNLLAIDASPIAVEVTTQNAEQLGQRSRVVVMQTRVQDLERRDLPSGWSWGQVDIIVANPPYIGPEDPEICPLVKKYEPAEALFAEDDGFRETTEWLAVVAKLLRPGGKFLLEHGATQAEKMRGVISAQQKFHDIRTYQDLSGWDRMLTAIKNG